MRALAVVPVLSLALAVSAAAVDITTCGQSVADADIGILQVDLDCSAQAGVCVHRDFADQEVACSAQSDCQPPTSNPCAKTAVTLGAGAILQLNGHTITGAGVLCSDAGICGVAGPGSILSAPVGVLARKKLIVAETTIDGGVYGIVSRLGGAILSNVTLTDNTSDGIWSWKGTIRANGVVATGNGGSGLYATLKPVVARDTTSSNNGGHGIDGYPSRGVNLTIEDNVGFGIVSEKGLSVRDSTITGNGLTYGGLDVASFRRPRVRNTVCDHSVDRSGGAGNWGVCALD
jgi:hypothetical protein